MKLKLATLASVALALTAASPVFATGKNFSSKPTAAANNNCTIARCRAIQKTQGWCPSETAVWCERHLPMGDACTPVPSGRSGNVC